MRHATLMRHSCDTHATLYTFPIVNLMINPGRCVRVCVVRRLPHGPLTPKETTEKTFRIIWLWFFQIVSIVQVVATNSLEQNRTICAGSEHQATVELRAKTTKKKVDSFQSRFFPKEIPDHLYGKARIHIKKYATKSVPETTEGEKSWKKYIFKEKSQS